MPSEPRTVPPLYHAAALAPVVAARLLATAILTIYGAQIVLVAFGMLEIAAAVVADAIVAAGVVIYARARRLDRATFGLTRAAATYLVAGALVGISAWYVNLRLVLLVDPPGSSQGLQTIVEQSPLAVTIIAIAVVPAIVEELVFRGIFVRALATRLPSAIAIGLGALVFSLYHLLPAQMISTLGLGLALSYLTLRADSVLPAMLAHLLNNAIAIVIARDKLPAAGRWMGAHPTATLVVASAVLASGLALAAIGPRSKA